MELFFHLQLSLVMYSLVRQYYTEIETMLTVTKKAVVKVPSACCICVTVYLCHTFKPTAVFPLLPFRVRIKRKKVNNLASLAQSTFFCETDHNKMDFRYPEKIHLELTIS